MGRHELVLGSVCWRWPVTATGKVDKKVMLQCLASSSVAVG